MTNTRRGRSNKKHSETGVEDMLEEPFNVFQINSDTNKWLEKIFYEVKDMKDKL